MDFAIVYVQLYELFPQCIKNAFDIQVTLGNLFSVIKYRQFNSLCVLHQCSMIKEKEGQETACGQNKIPVFYWMDYWKIPNQINTMKKDMA